MYVVSFSNSEHREKLEESTQVVRRTFERQHEAHTRELNEEYHRALVERSSQLRDECHAELLTSEAHVGAEWRQAIANPAVAENRAAVADRRVSDIESFIEQQVKVATSRER